MPVERHPEREVYAASQPVIEEVVEEEVIEEFGDEEASPKTLVMGGTTGSVNPVRILQATVGTITETFQVDGVATDPSPATATVKITAADGTVLVAAGSPTTRTGVGAFAFTLNTTQTALLNSYTILWTSTLGTLTTQVEVVGGFLFTIAMARANGLSDTSAYPSDTIIAARTLVETKLEDALGYALVPRYAYKRVRPSRGRLQLQPYIRDVRSVSIGGTALANTTLDQLSIEGSYLTGYPWVNTATVSGQILVGYEHGLDYAPPGAIEAAMGESIATLGAGSSIDSRATSLITDDGTIQLSAVGVSEFLSSVTSTWVAKNRIPLVA